MNILACWMGGSYSSTTIKEFGFDVNKLYRGDLEAAKESRQADWENFIRMTLAQQRMLDSDSV